MKPHRDSPGRGTGGRSGAPSATGTPCREPGARHKSPGSAASSSSSVARKALCHQPHAPRPLNSGKIINAAGSVCAGEVAPVTSPRGESSSWEIQRKQRFLPGELPAIQQLRGAGDRAGGAQTVPAPRERRQGTGMNSGRGRRELTPTPARCQQRGDRRYAGTRHRDGDRAAPGMVLHSLPHPRSRGTFGDVSAATTAAAIRSQCWTWILTGPNWQSGPG